MVIMRNPFKEDWEIEKENRRKSGSVGDFQLVTAEKESRYYSSKRPRMTPLPEDRARAESMMEWITRLDLNDFREELVGLLDLYLEKILEHDSQIESLKTRSRISTPDDLKLRNKENVDMIRKAFNLPELKTPAKGNVLRQMKGIFQDSLDEDVDAVDIIHSIRDD